MKDLIEFRAWNVKTERMSPPFRPLGGSPKDAGYANDSCFFMQYINKIDKNGNKIFVGDILKIRVMRSGWGYDTNINHKPYYLYAIVANVRGDLEYDQAEINKLEQPIGREVQRQSVGYDRNLFKDVYYCRHKKKDSNGQMIIDKSNNLGNFKDFYDYTVVSHIYQRIKLA